MIDFLSAETSVLLNPRFPEERRAAMQRSAEAVGLPGHVWLATSGTGGSTKLVALAKDAMLCSARAVNRRFGATKSDVWACVLPTFHVGGLSIFARAWLSGSEVVEQAWDPTAFVAACGARGVTLSSLVPAQVADLIANGLSAPPSVRAVVVGGGHLDEAQLLRAVELGWPLLPSYGMTECSSQIATAVDPGTSELRLLDHLEATTRQGLLAFRGGSVLTGLLADAGDASSFVDPKDDGWFVSADFGSVDGDLIRIAGRGADFVKIGGESVNLADLDRLLAGITSHAMLVAMPDPRLGWSVHLVHETEDASDVVRSFNERVLPFERIRGVHRVGSLPRTPLGKLIRQAARELVEKNSSTVE